MLNVFVHYYCLVFALFLKTVHMLIGIYKVHEGFPEQAIPANEQSLNNFITMGPVGLSLVLPPVLFELHCL